MRSLGPCKGKGQMMLMRYLLGRGGGAPNWGRCEGRANIVIGILLLEN